MASGTVGNHLSEQMTEQIVSALHSTNSHLGEVLRTKDNASVGLMSVPQQCSTDFETKKSLEVKKRITQRAIDHYSSPTRSNSFLVRGWDEVEADYMWGVWVERRAPPVATHICGQIAFKEMMVNFAAASRHAIKTNSIIALTKFHVDVAHMVCGHLSEEEAKEAKVAKSSMNVPIPLELITCPCGRQNCTYDDHSPRNPADSYIHHTSCTCFTTTAAAKTTTTHMLPAYARY